MRKKSYQFQSANYRTYRKFVNLQMRIRQLMASEEFFELSNSMRKRLLRRLNLLYSRLVKALGKHKLQWAGAIVALIFSISTLKAGYDDPVSLAGISTGISDSPAFVDMDDDGDMDLVVGQGDGLIRYYENIDGIFLEQTGGNNPFDGETISYGHPTFGDIDDDGDMDMVIGDNVGLIHYYENNAGTFTELTGVDNPFDAIDVGDIAKPQLFDWDDDNDLDLVSGNNEGFILYFENDGGVFTELTGVDNPFDGIDVGTRSSPALADFDDDGDIDLFVGDKYGAVFYYENSGSSFSGQVGGNNPANDISLELLASITILDFDDDGDYDIVAGNYAVDNPHYFRNEAGTLVEKRGTGNPFEMFPKPTGPALAFGDVDDDGDMDMILAANMDSLMYFENDGDYLNPRSGEDDPFEGLTFGGFANALFADIDDDSDIDLIAGRAAGDVQYVVNDAGTFVELTGGGNPFDGVTTSGYSAPTLVDIDDDDDLDLFVGQTDGSILYYKNVTGTYVQQTGGDNPFDGMDFGSYPRLAFKDVDGDGDWDLVVGDDDDDAIEYAENDGGVFTIQTGLQNPFSDFSFNYPSVTFYDFDGDGDEDLLIGAYQSGVWFSEYTPAGVNITIGTEPQTTEEGGTEIFSVSLEAKPRADVTISMASDNTNEGTLSESSLTFTEVNWETPQAVTVSGVDDAIEDGDQTYNILFSVASTDPEYEGLNVANLTLVNLDDETTFVDDKPLADGIFISTRENVLIIDAEDNFIEKVEVIGLNGQVIYQNAIDNSGRVELVIEDVKSGVYIVRVKSEGNYTTKKVLF
jgi:hypothetical protein